MPKRPNVLFFFADDQRFDTLQAWGNPEIITPNLDRIAQMGTSFRQAHIMGGTHEAVCMPSRAMMLTGRGLFEIQDEGQAIPEAHCLMGQAFGQAGYETFGTGKWHNGSESFNRCFETGSEIYFGGMADHWNVPANHYDPSGAYSVRMPLCVDPWTTNELNWRHCDHVSAGKHSSELVAEATLRFLDERDRQRPFFAYLSYMAPHDPRTMPSEYLEMYDPATLSLPPNFLEEHPFDNGEFKVRDEQLERWPRTPEAIRKHLAEYYAMITHLDAQLGRVLDRLEAQGIMEETILVFAGDNGLALGQHGLMGKQNLYDHSVRVPLLLAGPGIPSEHQSQALCYLNDIFPTLCSLTDIPRPESVTGVDLSPTFSSETWTGRDALYLAYRDCQRAVRTESLKLIEYRTDAQIHTQLFYLSADPYECNNLAAQQPEVTARLRDELKLLRLDASDTRPKEQAFWKNF